MQRATFLERFAYLQVSKFNAAVGHRFIFIEGRWKTTSTLAGKQAAPKPEPTASKCGAHQNESVLWNPCLESEPNNLLDLESLSQNFCLNIPIPLGKCILHFFRSFIFFWRGSCPPKKVIYDLEGHTLQFLTPLRRGRSENLCWGS